MAMPTTTPLAPGMRKFDDLNDYESTVKFKGEMPKIVKLTPQQKTAWEMTRAALLWTCPAFTSILYNMMQAGTDVAVFTSDVPTAGVDGRYVYVNPEFFFKRSLQERVFIMAHEVCHAIFNHCGLMHMFHKRGKVVTPGGKEFKYDHQVMNMAMDLVINDMLVKSNVGTFVQGGLHDINYGKSGDSIVDVYEKVFKDKKNNKSPKGSGFDVHLQPGQGKGDGDAAKDPDAASADRSEIEWSAAVAAGMASAKAQGKLPGELERFFKQMLEPEIPWQEKIMGFFARKVGSDSYDWKRPDRRLIVRDIYAPGRTGFGCGDIVVAVDTSGSVGQPELDVFFAEMKGILDMVKPRRMHIVWCDSKIHKVDEVFSVEDIDGLKSKGGGGTDFKPPFEWVEKNNIQPDALVYLTDGIGGFPDKPPRYPVLWGAILKGPTYPWGEVVDVPLKNK